MQRQGPHSGREAHRPKELRGTCTFLSQGTGIFMDDVTSAHSKRDCCNSQVIYGKFGSKSFDVDSESHDVCMCQVMKPDRKWA